MPDNNKKPGESRTSVSQSRKPPAGYVAAGYHLIKKPTGNGKSEKKKPLGRKTALSVVWGGSKKGTRRRRKTSKKSWFSGLFK
jgi:hypothetical protein